MIIISDIHGRQFWKNIVKGHEDEEIIFLGDYHDPYSYEGITRIRSINNLKKIIEFKRKHMDNVILLIGNHDVHYISHKYCLSSRHDDVNTDTLEKLFADNIDLFQLSYYKEIGDKKIIFSHAGITKYWYDGMLQDLVHHAEGRELVNILNQLFIENNEGLITALNCISFLRGGRTVFGSMVWADAIEMMDEDNLLEGYYQIFGHTQQEVSPIITDKIACLDVRRGFLINDKGKIEEI